ncbi:PP2C family serine/threonine-protein phosphatase [Nocardioides sp.]|uniref:PP2C family protein-serine/threonine phosphatase n=1 Tax=Nocardioides sp. TaxID=35761 RepID=UPI002733D133|nr:protein phosphatase 2C domain-containing protein [Nocardioides sp.]MDP3892096.1 protein phosphatase 2C domain-containing protein [Nocardioides sp.]
MVSLHFGSHTHVGRVRAVNEDSFLAVPPVFVVADGMGGHHGGDMASRLAVEEFAQLGDASYDAHAGAEAIAGALRESQRRIVDFGRGGPAQSSPGTTVVAALLVEEPEGSQWLLTNLGDSRIYKMSGDSLEQVSVDHSLVQELVDAGTITAEDAAHHPERHVVTRALGGSVVSEADFFLLPVSAAPRLLLCSDGVNGMLSDAEMSRILLGAPDPRDAADQLVAAAVEAGGRDNATAVVVDVMGLSEDDVRAGQHSISLEEKLGALP